jgi:hypothetical protein
MKIQVTFEMDEDDDLAEPDHEMGVSEDCYLLIHRVIPGYDIEIKRIE